ncbi:MAG TPA: hypoxanthine phosphoribosyltransferase, partial [Ruminococcus sp.]|nr:hypoxanthine phosphoribosyltransferase [Ruminococcus sp.]
MELHKTEVYNSRINRVLISEEEIRTAVAKAGELIDSWYDGRPMLLVSILKGSFVFLADLARAIKSPC